VTDEPLHPLPTGDSPAKRAASLLAITLAVVGQVIVLVPFTVASGLVAPLWAVVVLHGLWLASAFSLWPTGRRFPLLTPLIPLANAILLWLAVIGGERLLGWTA
jgi:hypothetical protein